MADGLDRGVIQRLFAAEALLLQFSQVLSIRFGEGIWDEVLFFGPKHLKRLGELSSRLSILPPPPDYWRILTPAPVRWDEDSLTCSYNGAYQLYVGAVGIVEFYDRLQKRQWGRDITERHMEDWEKIKRMYRNSVGR